MFLLSKFHILEQQIVLFFDIKKTTAKKKLRVRKYFCVFTLQLKILTSLIILM